jgi:hypothetical protein
MMLNLAGHKQLRSFDPAIIFTQNFSEARVSSEIVHGFHLKKLCCKKNIDVRFELMKLMSKLT